MMHKDYEAFEKMEWEYPVEDVCMGQPEDFLDNRGAGRIRSLFVELLPETAYELGFEPVFTLARWDKGKYKSMYKMFMEDKDPTGYTTCMRTLGNWELWKRVWSSARTKAYLDEWVEELEISLVAESIATMRACGTPTSAKWLADKGWNEESKKKRGRPSKKEVERERKFQARVKDELDDDAKRIGLLN